MKWLRRKYLYWKWRRGASQWERMLGDLLCPGIPLIKSKTLKPDNSRWDSTHSVTTFSFPLPTKTFPLVPEIGRIITLEGLDANGNPLD